MSEKTKLKALSSDDLLKELRARGAYESSRAPEEVFHPDKDLENVDSGIIIQELRDKQKVIYGTDNRVDLFNINDPLILGNADGVVALFDVGDIIDNGNGTSTLQTQNFGTARNLCASERFRNQPIGCFCSGFLVAPDVIATAGHCINDTGVHNVRFVFGFRMLNANSATTIVNNTDIYSGIRIIGRQLTNEGDWALVRTDRLVSNHRILPVRFDGRVADNQGVYVIGHPVGLPTKFADGANVRDNSQGAFFVANLDTYGGNSGSPVFNRDTHIVEGILVRGETDFTFDPQGACNVSLVCPDTGCRGEDCTRTREFQYIGIGHDDLPVPFSAGSIVSVSGFHSADDQRRNVMVGTTQGKVHEIFWKEGTVGVEGHDDLPVPFSAGSIVSVSGFHSADDQRRNVMVGTTQGKVHEIFWKEGTVGVEGHDDLPVPFSAGSIVSVSGFHSADDQRRNVMVGTTDGKVHEIFWKSDTVGIEGHDDLPVSFSAGSIVSVSGFYSADDQRRIVIVGTTDGKVHEIFWKSDTVGIEGHDVLPVSFSAGSIVSVSGFYSADDQRRNVMVGTTDGKVSEIFWKSDTVGIEGHDDLPVPFSAGSIVSVSGFYSADDQRRIVIVGTTDGKVSEIFWNRVC